MTVSDGTYLCKGGAGMKGYEVKVTHPRNCVITYDNVRHMQLTSCGLYLRGRESDGKVYTIRNDDPIVSIEIREEDED